jgi:eukaryotic translation initiation factor 2C
MLKVPSERLPFPSVQYAANTRNKGREVPKPKKQSGWNLQDFEAFVTVKATSLKYFVIHDLPASSASNVVDNFCQEIKNQMGLRLQMSAQNVICLNPNGIPERLDGGNLESLVKQAKSLRADLVVLILPSPNRFVYAEFKTLADKEYGLHSLCVAKPAELDPARRAKYMTNIAQKINIKFNGVNSRVEEVIKYLGNDTIVLGADVIHPGPAALPDAPSIACMVGSVDPYGGKFLGSTRLQSKDKKDREVSLNSYV